MIKHLILVLKIVIAAPLEVVKKPVLMILQWSSILFSLGAGGCLLLYFIQEDASFIRPFVFSCLISAGSAFAKFIFLKIVLTVNPYYGWVAQRQEDNYFDEQYRLDEYKFNRNYDKNMFDKQLQREASVALVKLLESQQRLENQLNQQLSSQQRLDQKYIDSKN